MSARPMYRAYLYSKSSSSPPLTNECPDHFGQIRVIMQFSNYFVGKLSRRAIRSNHGQEAIITIIYLALFLQVLWWYWLAKMPTNYARTYSRGSSSSKQRPPWTPDYHVMLVLLWLILGKRFEFITTIIITDRKHTPTFTFSNYLDLEHTHIEYWNERVLYVFMRQIVELDPSPNSEGLMSWS